MTYAIFIPADPVRPVELRPWPEPESDRLVPELVQVDWLQQAVGGYIEAVYSLRRQLTSLVEGDLVMVINEEGKLARLPLNLRATALYQYGDTDPIAGDVLLVSRQDPEMAGFEEMTARVLVEALQ